MCGGDLEHGLQHGPQRDIPSPMGVPRTLYQREGRHTGIYSFFSIFIYIYIQEFTHFFYLSIYLYNELCFTDIEVHRDHSTHIKCIVKYARGIFIFSVGV